MKKVKPSSEKKFMETYELLLATAEKQIIALII